MRAALARLRNHLVTGFLFIMPVLIVFVVLARFWSKLLKVGNSCSRFLRVDTVLGSSGDAVMAVLFFLFICTVAGFLIRLSFLRRLSERIDRHLNDWIPGYSQIRAEAKQKIGAEEKAAPPVYPACLVRVQDLWQPGYIVEKNADGTRTVFVPLAPAGTSGQVYVVELDRIRDLGSDSAALQAQLARLGKGLMSR
ncbi:MAG TPA: hypothetical protein VFV75_09525 [Candidatus Polarisedimenticolaceae bacterium]|nr:hypothetical protein [Candidatus Polarisedimenticolaceae bacterium]